MNSVTNYFGYDTFPNQINQRPVKCHVLRANGSADLQKSYDNENNDTCLLGRSYALCSSYPLPYKYRQFPPQDSTNELSLYQLSQHIQLSFHHYKYVCVT